jgi:ankyrin repeat protein
MTRLRILMSLLLVATPFVAAAQPWQVGPKARQVDEDLLQAVLERDLGRTTRLLTQGANPNFVKDTKTAQKIPVLLAALPRRHERGDRKKSWEIAKALVAAGASTSLADPAGSLTMCTLVSSDDAEALDVLLEMRADINSRGTDGETMLMHAAGEGSEAVVAYLLSRGADACLRNKRGATAADYARSFIADALEAGETPDEGIVRRLELACPQPKPN